MPNTKNENSTLVLKISQALPVRYRDSRCKGGYTVRKSSLLFLLILLYTILLSASAAAETSAPASQVVLYTYYQAAEEDRLEIGCIDRKGNLYSLSGSGSDLQWPASAKDQPAWFTSRTDFTRLGSVKQAYRDRIRNLLTTVRDHGTQARSNPGSLGTEVSYAVRYEHDGTPVLTLLGMSGDQVFENTDPDAQSLYRVLRSVFSDVTSFAYNDPDLGPSGFQPLAVTDFLGVLPAGVETARITAVYSDCETGNHPVDLSKEEIETIRHMILYGMVTDKADSMLTTGSITTYYLTTPSGKNLFSLEMHGNLLVGSDGMYYLSE